MAPFKAAILNLKVGDAACDATVRGQLYATLAGAALYDDRDERAGVKFDDADLMGHPWQIVVGPRGAAAGHVELKRRATGERQELDIDGGARPDRLTGADMFGPFERAVAGRYLRARRGERFVSVIAIFSLVGIALGVATLIIVMSVMNGFRQELLGRILGLNGDLGIYAAGAPLTNYDDIVARREEAARRRPRHGRGRRAGAADQRPWRPAGGRAGARHDRRPT